MSAQRGLVSQAANAGSFEGTSVTTCVTKRKDPQHTVLKHTTQVLATTQAH